MALGLGFLAQQSFTEPRSSLDAKVMEALLPATAADDPDRQAEARQLQEIQARRADVSTAPPPSGPSPRGELALAEPAAGRPVPLEARVALLRQAGRPTLSAGAPGVCWMVRVGSCFVAAGGTGQLERSEQCGSLAGERWWPRPAGEWAPLRGTAAPAA